MKKIIVLLLSLVLVLGITNIAFAVTEDKEPVRVEAVQEEIVIAEPVTVETEAEAVCPHTWGEWYYDLTEHDDGSITYFRTCHCGAYEELSEQTFYDAGGQYENCDKGRHYWYEDTDIRYCEECGYSEEI